MQWSGRSFGDARPPLDQTLFEDVDDKVDQENEDREDQDPGKHANGIEIAISLNYGYAIAL